MGKAKEELNEGISLLNNRQKIIKLADKSEFGGPRFKNTYVMIWPTMKRKPQKLKRLRKEPPSSLKLCKRKRENLVLNFPFPRLRQATFPELVVSSVHFLLLVAIFAPRSILREHFQRLRFVFSMRKERSLGQLLSLQR